MLEPKKSQIPNAGRSIEVLNNYLDMEEISRSTVDGIIDSRALLAGLSGNETRVIRGRDGIEKISLRRYGCYQSGHGKERPIHRRGNRAGV